MNTIEAIRTRRSIRAFSRRTVEDSVIKEILTDVGFAPSAGNLRSRDVIVVRNKETKIALAKAAFHQDFVEEADVVFVFCANRKKAAPYGKRGTELYCVQDADAAVMCALLSIHERGLGSVWVGAFDEKEVAMILKLPDYVTAIAILPVGYPKEEKEPHSPPALKEFVHEERW